MPALTEKRIHTGSLILVNGQYGIHGEPGDLLVPACDTSPGILLCRRAAVLLNELMQEIHGWRSIVPVSGYRSREEQQRIWDDSLRENGETFTKKYVARPGHSEHQTGLAIDLGLRQENIDFIRPEFPSEGICQVFREKAAKYGFILRYPPGKEKITGIAHEPWHFRYVGAPHAQIMEKNGLTLEEYIDFIRQFSYDSPYLTQCGSREVHISRLSEDSMSPGEAAQSSAEGFSGDPPRTVSGDNIDGLILTEYFRRY